MAAAGRFGVFAPIVGVWQIAGHMLRAPVGVPGVAATTLASTVAPRRKTPVNGDADN